MSDRVGMSGISLSFSWNTVSRFLQKRIFLMTRALGMLPHDQSPAPLGEKNHSLRKELSEPGPKKKPSCTRKTLSFRPLTGDRNRVQEHTTLNTENSKTNRDGDGRSKQDRQARTEDQ